MVLVAVLLGLALLPSRFWRAVIIHEISSVTGRAAAIDGNVTLRIFSLNPELVVEDFRLANADWAAEKSMLTIQRFDATLSLTSLLRLQLVFPRVAIETPVLHLERDASGRANWDVSKPATRKSEHASAPLHIPAIQQLLVSNGTLTANDRIRKLQFEGRITAEEQQKTTEANALVFRGEGKLNDKPFELVLNGAPFIDIQPTKPYSFDVNVTAADITLSAHTVFPHPFDLAKVHATFRVTGRDLADVYYLTGLALPNTPPYEVSGTAERDQLHVQIDDLRGKLGSSDIAGKLQIDTGRERPKLTAALTSTQLNLADLAAPLGTQASAQRKSNTLAKPAATAAAPGASLLLPDADLQVQRVRGMDADVLFEASSVITEKMPMRKVHFHLNLDNGKITVDPLAFVLAEGEFSGTVAIDARSAIPQTDLDMQLSNVSLAQFKPQSSNNPPLEGQLLGRVRLHGAGTSVHKAAADADGDITLVVPKGEMREALAELTGIDLSRGLGLIVAKNQRDTEIRCGVANFHAARGTMKASALVIDTTNVLITGSGQIDLKSEALDLALRGQPKEARLLRVRTPIMLKGSLLHPKVGVQVGKLAEQTGAAVALGTLLTPVAAILAFVDRGLAKDANCAALVSQAEQDNGVHKE
jgi:uncharacterized protein involved in outer membrane biogenesis